MSIRVLRAVLVVILVVTIFSLASAQAQYYYHLTGISSGSCAGSPGAVQIQNVAISRIAYLPAGDIESWELFSSTGGFASGGGSGTFSVGPIGPGAVGTFGSGITTTAGQEPVTMIARVTSNMTSEVTALTARCDSATSTPVVTVQNGALQGVQTMDVWGMIIMVLALLTAALITLRRYSLI